MDAEVRRRFGHASGSVVPSLYVFDLISWTQLQYIAVCMSAFVITWEVLRHRFGIDLLRVHKSIRRDYEEESVSSLFWGSLSSTAVVFIFRPMFALPAILMMMVADPVAGLLSTDELRSIKRPRAVAGMFLTSLLLALPFLVVEASFLAATGATIADSAKPRLRNFVVDDNLSIPIVAAAAAYVAVDGVAGTL